MPRNLVRLAVAPIAWRNDDMPALGGDTPIDTILRESRAAGFCGTELGGAFPRDAAEMKPLLAAHNLSLASGWFSGLLHKNQSVEERNAPHGIQLRCFAELGVDTLFYCDTSGSVQGDPQRPAIHAPDHATRTIPRPTAKNSPPWRSA